MTATRIGLAACAAAAGALALAACGTNGPNASATTTTPVPATTAAPASTAGPATTTAPTTAPPTTAPLTSKVPPTTTAAPASPALIIHAASGQTVYDGSRPTSISYSYDSTNIVDHLTWATWGPTTAVGHGIWSEDNCTPNCASGTVTDVPATITLGTVSGGHFTSMTERAGTLDKTYSYPTNWAVGAH